MAEMGCIGARSSVKEQLGFVHTQRECVQAYDPGETQLKVSIPCCYGNFPWESDNYCKRDSCFEDVGQLVEVLPSGHEVLLSLPRASLPACGVLASPLSTGQVEAGGSVLLGHLSYSEFWASLDYLGSLSHKNGEMES